MDLAIEGLKIARAYKNAYAVEVEFDLPGVGIKFESEFFVVHSGRDIRIVPERDDEESFLHVFQPLIGVAVDKAVAEESGELWVRMVNNSLLKCGPGDLYEPWAFYGPGNVQVWSLPGGSITATAEFGVNRDVD